MTTGMPFSDLMGLEILERSKERVIGHLTVRDELCTAGGILHGGAFMAFADALGAIGAVMNLEGGARTTTLESKTNFLRGAPVGSVVQASPCRCTWGAGPASGRRGSPAPTASCWRWSPKRR